MARRKADKPKIDTGRWLNTYADMMNNLLVLFMVLYAMSVMDLKKFQALATQFSVGLNNTEIQSTITPSEITPDADIVIPPVSEETPPVDTADNTANQESEKQFDSLYEKLKTGIEAQGYSDVIELEKEDAYIKFKFKNSVLFYPDSANMRPVGIEALEYVGNLLKDVNKYTDNIEIGGHTAQTGSEAQATIYAWELSADRAISVLKYLVQDCGLSQSKMSIAGYSHYDPVGDNSTEAGRSTNRRVEIKVNRLTEDPVEAGGG